MPPAPLPHLHTGEGRRLLLLHGLGSFRGHWEPLVEHLAAQHELSAPDLPGFGDCEPLEGPSTISRLADALVGHLDALGWESCHVAGNSLGGLLSLELARRDRALTVTAISPAGMARGWEDRMARAMLHTQRWITRRFRPIIRRAADSPLLRTIGWSGVAGRPRKIDPDLAARLAHAYADSPVVEHVLEVFDEERTTKNLDEITCPVTIAWGSRDRLLLPRQGERFARQLKDVRLVRLPGLGHSPMTDDPALVARVISETTGAHELA